MAGSSNKMLSSTPLIAVATASHAACTVTVTAPSNPKMAIYLDGIIISANAAPSAAVAATVTGPSATLTLYLPASAFAPIGFGFGTHPIPCAASTNLVVSVPDLGATPVLCSVVVLYHIDTL